MSQPPSKKARVELPIRTQLFINNEWVHPDGGRKTYETRSPGSGEVLAATTQARAEIFSLNFKPQPRALLRMSRLLRARSGTGRSKATPTTKANSVPGSRRCKKRQVLGIECWSSRTPRDKSRHLSNSAQRAFAAGRSSTVMPC